jgi:hypothetical protein
MIKTTLRLAFTTLFAILLTTVITSCEHKQLCYLHEHTNAEGKLKVRIDVDWSQFDGELPSGMTVAIYPIDSNEPTIITSNNIDYVTTYLSPGLYHIEVMNYSTSEFGTLDFLENSYGHTIGIKAKETTSTWYTLDEDEVLAMDPEAFGFERQTYVAVQDPYADDEDEMAGRANDELVIATLHPVNIIYTVDVNVRLRGVKNLRSCAGAVQGLASLIKYSDLSNDETKVTHLIESWSFSNDYIETDSGVLKASFSSFGLPTDNKRVADNNTLKISFLLVDNKTILSYTIPVGDKITEIGQRHYSIDVTDAIELPETESTNQSTGSAGFDVTVDEWTNEEDVDIEI